MNWKILVLILGAGLLITFLTPSFIPERPPYNLETLEHYDVGMAQGDLASGQYEYRRLKDFLDKLKEQEKKEGYDSDRSRYYEALGTADNLDAIKSWAKKAPDSVHPWLVMGDAYLSIARGMREGKTLDDIPEAVRDPYRKTLGNAQEAYTKAIRADKDVQGYAGLVGACAGLQCSREEMDLLYAEGLQRRPSSLILHWRKAEYLSPMNGGKPAEFEVFINDSIRGEPLASGMNTLRVLYHREMKTFLGKDDWYYRDPKVWAALKVVLQDHLNVFPEHDWARCFLVRLAVLNDEPTVGLPHLDRVRSLGPRAWQAGGWESEEEFNKDMALLESQRGTVTPLIGAVTKTP